SEKTLRRRITIDFPLGDKPGRNARFFYAKMEDLFKRFDDDAVYMGEWIKQWFVSAPEDLRCHMIVSVTVSDARIKLAIAAYRAEIAHYAEYLDSQNPDHYKRCGALLFA